MYNAPAKAGAFFFVRARGALVGPGSRQTEQCREGREAKRASKR